MKYVLLFCGTVAEDEAWQATPEETRNAGYADVGKWFERYGPQLEGGYELQSVSTATTVRKNGAGERIVTDGPYAESGEVVGGFTVMKANDLDEVLAAAKAWPGGAVEIRPVVER